MATKPETEDKEKQKKVNQGLRNAALEDCALCQESISSSELAAKARDGDFEDPPDWVPDEVCSYCTACKAPFTVIRRKHHCRSCGKIFCSRCSSHSAPLPRYGQMKPVRVCTHCYMFHVTPFYSDKAGIWRIKVLLCPLESDTDRCVWPKPRVDVKEGPGEGVISFDIHRYKFCTDSFYCILLSC